jgi:hypothetical protein
VKCRRCSTYSLIDLSAVNLAVHGLIERLTHLIGGLGWIVSPFSITKVVQRVRRGADAGCKRLLAQSGHSKKTMACK